MSPNKYWSTFIACAFKLGYLSMEKVSSILIFLPDYQKALAKKRIVLEENQIVVSLKSPQTNF